MNCRNCQELVEALEELLSNIYDAEDHLHPETGQQLPDGR